MEKRQQLLAIFEAGLKAVQPDAALLAHLHLAESTLVAGAKEYDCRRGKIIVVGAGKGAAPMAKALESILAGRIDEGYIVVKYGHGLELEHLALSEAAHPVPDAAGEAGAARILELAASAGPGDLLICLLTGGASALLPAPAPGLTLQDLQQATSLLLSSGATIAELNAVRKHLSRLSGGLLAKAANGAEILSIIVSDVIGDDLGAIASGPTAPDISTFQECLNIVQKYGLRQKLPANVIERLETGAAGLLPETPKPDDPVFSRVNNIIVASNQQCLDAAAAKAAELGYNTRINSAPLSGEARMTAANLVENAKAIAKSLATGAQPVCLLAGGETTVTIKGDGLGGRNQEMALAAAIEIEEWPGLAALFAGTDGTDGPTDAAGGYAFADTVSRMGGSSLARAYLSRNDSYHGLEKAGDLLVTGPTRTNVMDMAILLIEPDSHGGYSRM